MVDQPGQGINPRKKGYEFLLQMYIIILDIYLDILRVPSIIWNYNTEVARTNRRVIMATKLLLELKNLLADLASTLILGKNKDAACLAMKLSEKSKALAEELVK
mgnify:CR=1 FL=1|jgi:hypothetical protein